MPLPKVALPDQRGPDEFESASDDYPWGNVYDGHLMAHALHAANATVDQLMALHSFHAYAPGGRTGRTSTSASRSRK